jgi:hypothetical protein
LKLGNYVPKTNFEILLSRLSLTQKQLLDERRNSQRTTTLRLEIEKDKKEREKERKIEEILIEIDRYCDTKIIIDEDTFKWVVIVNKIDDSSFLFLNKISKLMDNEMRSLFKKRLKGRDIPIQVVLEEVLLKRRKTFSEKLLEIDLGEFSGNDRSFHPL